MVVWKSYGILLARCQLPFQIGDLLFGNGDLLIPFRYLLLELLNLVLLPLHLPLQFFPAGRMRVRMPTRVCMLPACAPGGSPIPPRLKRHTFEPKIRKIDGCT
jgi:hypothetical protein